MMCLIGKYLLVVTLAASAWCSPFHLKDVPKALTKQFLSENELEEKIGRAVDGNEEDAVLVTTEKKHFNGKPLLKLRSNDKKVEIELEPAHKLISPDAKVTFVKGDKEETFAVSPSLRSSFYQGLVVGVPSSLASLVQNDNGWHGVIMSDDGHYTLQTDKRSKRSLLLPFSLEDGDFQYKNDIFNLQSNMKNANEEMLSRKSRDERQSRSVKQGLQLEVGVYTDEDLFQYVKQKYPSDDTVDKLQEIAFITLNTVHTYYQKPGLGEQIDVIVASLTIMETNLPGITTSTNMETYLDNFCHWDVTNNNKGGKKYDIGLLLSGIDMYNGEDPTDTSALGLAPLTGACNTPKETSCAIGQATGFGTGIVITHEIGHNLGMDHDSDGNDCDDTGFIMGAAISSGATTFSSCSRDYLQKYLQKLDDFGLNCLRNTGNTAMEHSVEGQLPGERISADEQCSYSEGPGWTAATDEENFCAKFFCKRDGQVESPNGGPPLPGTPCDTGKVCWNGICRVRDEVVAEIEEYTPAKSGSSASALSSDELCAKYGDGHDAALTYEKAISWYGSFDMTPICNKGLYCSGSSGILRLNMVAPPGTTCDDGKVCHYFECVDKNSIDSSGGSGPSGKKPPSNTGGNGGSGSNGGNGGSGSNGGNGGAGSPSNEGFKSGRQNRYCQSSFSKESKGSRTTDCTKAKCLLNDFEYEVDVYHFNICPGKKLCQAGKCVPKNKAKKLSRMQHYRSAMDECKKAGKEYKALCSRRNILMYPDLEKNCKVDKLCQFVLCTVNLGSGMIERKKFTTDTISKCGSGKKCNKNKECKKG